MFGLIDTDRGWLFLSRALSMNTCKPFDTTEEVTIEPSQTCSQQHLTICWVELRKDNFCWWDYKFCCQFALQKELLTIYRMIFTCSNWLIEKKWYFWSTCLTLIKFLRRRLEIVPKHHFCLFCVSWSKFDFRAFLLMEFIIILCRWCIIRYPHDYWSTSMNC